MQDQEGTIWLATQVGIDKITGDHIENVKGFNKKLTEQLTLLYDIDDRHILVATDERNSFIGKWVGDSTRVLNFPVVNIRHIAPLSRDTLLLFTHRGIYLSDRKFTWYITRRPTFDIINSVLPAGNAQFYLGTEQGLYQYDARTDNLTLLDKRLPVNALCFNADSSAIFVGFNSLYIRKLIRSTNLYDRTFHIDPDNQAEPYRAVTSFFLENDSLLWVGTRNAGLHVLNVNRKHEQYLIQRPGTEINCIYLSKDGVIWVGTNTAGIGFCQPDRQRFRHYFDNSYLRKIIDKIDPGPKVPASLNNNVWSILPIAKDSILLGTNGNGIALLNPRLDRIVSWIPAEDARQNSVHQVVNCLIPDGKQVLLATEGGLFRWNPGRHKQTYERVTIDHRPVLADTSLSILNFDASRTYLLAGSKRRGELYILGRDFRRIATCRLPNSGESLSLLYNVNAFHHGFTLVGTTSALYKFNPDTRTLTRLTDSSKQTHFISAYQRPYNDTVWLGTDRQGLQAYANTPAFTLVAKYYRKDGLPDEVIYAISGDRLGNYWFSTNHGIYRFSHGKGFNLYDNDDVANLHEFNTGSFAAMGDSILLFGGLNGVSALTPLTTINRTADTIFRPVLRCIHPSGDEEMPLDTSYIDFNLAVNERTGRIGLSYKFGYLELYPMLGQHQNPANTHFEVMLNGQPVTRREDGRYLVHEEELAATFRFFYWDRLRIGNNTLMIRYRTAMGEWRTLPPIYIDRFWLTGSNWVVVGFALILCLVSFLIAKVFMNSTRIRVLQDKTIEITRIDDIDELGLTSLTHMLHGLKFHYAVISFIDFDNYRIKGVYGDSRNKRITDPKKWLHLSDYPLDHDDILAQVASIGESVPMYRNKHIPNKKIRPSPYLFNQEITQKYKHENLARIYMPIVYRSTRNTGKPASNDSYDPKTGDVVLGVIEAGYEGSFVMDFSFFLLSPLIFIVSVFNPKQAALQRMELQRIRLQLYMESFARSYSTAYIRDQQAKVESLIRDIDNAYDLPKLPGEFLEASLAALGRKMSVFKANIALSTYNMEEMDFTDEAFFHNCTRVEMMHKLDEHKERNEGRKGIMRWVADHKEAAYSGDVHNDARYVMAFEEARSELSIPMLSDNKTLLGVIDFLSERPYYFNTVMLKYCQPGVQKMTEIFIRRKQYEAFQEIVPSFESYNHTEEDTYQRVVATLQKYFFADHTSVWTRESNNSLAFILHDSTLEPLKSAYHEEGLIRSVMTDDYRADEPLVELRQIGEKDNSIGRFCRKKDHQFKFYILLKVVIDNRYQAFINIFSRREVVPNALQAAQGLSSFNQSFLTEIVKKIAATTQTNRLWRFIRDVSLSLSQRDTVNAQQTIVNEAYLLMPSVASVVLFSYAKGSAIRLTDAQDAGIKMHHLGEGERPAHLANLIVGDETQWIEKREQYKVLAERAGPPNNPDFELFWDKYKLQSVAAIKLESQGVPIGVMFFNYTTLQRFENGKSDTARLIKAFANLAEISLINEDLVRRIENERNQSGKAKDEAEKRASETYEKMMNILPYSTRASLFDIVQQVNHEIINQLQFVGLHLLRMQGTAERWNYKDRADLEDNIKLVNVNMERCSELVLLFQPSAFKNTMEDLNEIVRLTAGLFIKKYNVNDEEITRFDLSGLQKHPMPDIYCVKAELSMMIYNLFANAEKAIGEKRQKTKFSPCITVFTAYDSKHDMFSFVINDNGIGMDNQVREQIFQLGFTTRLQEEGKPNISKIHGIGLHFVQQCLERHYEGEVACESKKNVGTTFTMRFTHYNSPE